MKQDMEKAEMEKLLKTIEGHPLTKQILAEEAAAILAKRKEAAGKIEVLKKQREEVIPHLQADIEAKEAKYKKAKAALDADLGELQTARATLSSERYQFDNDIRNHEVVLYETADPALDAAIEFFRGRLDELRKPGKISINRLGGERNIFTETVTLKAESNAAAILDAMKYCQAAIKALEILKLSPALDLEKIEEMKKGIPDIGIYTESTGEKPLPGSKGINPLHLLPSDSEMDWKFGKLMEKAKKVLGK